MFGTVLVIKEWSSSLSLQARMSVLCRFALRKVNGIVCTDTLGCSIDDIDVVISYEIDRIGSKTKFQLTLVEAGRQPLEPIEIHLNAEEEYAVMYSAVLNDLCEGCEALDLEKQ
ncbi:hypothetical protein quinque_015026 [Culex quinquefasciatus]